MSKHCVMVAMWCVCDGSLEQDIEELETGVPASKPTAENQDLINVSEVKDKY